MTSKCRKVTKQKNSKAQVKLKKANVKLVKATKKPIIVLPQLTAL